MSEALYAPALGYYAAGNIKLPGSNVAHHVQPSGWTPPPDGSPLGDFVTAPELSPIFARTLAGQVASVLSDCASFNVLEFGAGTGVLAADLIDALDALGVKVNYAIIEISDDLRGVQQRRLARFGARVTWPQALPETFSGCVLANELLDAMPVTVFAFDGDARLMECGVSVGAQGQFVWSERPASDELRAQLEGRVAPMPGYRSEINLQAEAWMRSLSNWLTCGAALLIDYGFPQSEYYHPQRAEGTLMAHIRHHAHSDVLVAPGIQDITAHVDFTAMAQAAIDGGLDLLGYTAQGRFLMNAGLVDHIGASTDPRQQANALGAISKLTSEAEMGELFKVLAVGRGIDTPLTGFKSRDRRHLL